MEGRGHVESPGARDCVAVGKGVCVGAEVAPGGDISCSERAKTGGGGCGAGGGRREETNAGPLAVREKVVLEEDEEGRERRGSAMEQDARLRRMDFFAYHLHTAQ